MFTQEELKNISALISRANILTGHEALVVAMLQQKLQALIVKDDKKDEQGVQGGEQRGEEPKQTKPKQKASS